MSDDIDRIRALPCWQGRPDISPLSGGLSNANYLVADGAGKHVVRFGVDYPFHHVSRDREVMTARAAHAAGFAPEIQYAAPGVMVSQFIGARTCDASDVRANPERIARLLKSFHTEMAGLVTGPGFMFWVFHVIRDYAHTLENSGSPYAPQTAPLVAEASALEAMQIPLPIIFGHNDLLPANFLDDGKKLWLIDFEYAGFNTAMFDLAGAASNAGMDAQQSELLLEVYFGVKPDGALLRAFDAMQCAALLRETMWGMVSAKFLNAPGVDYDAYTAENLAKYRAAINHLHARHGKPTA